MIDVDKPLKKGFFIPFDSSTNVRSCLLSGHKPLSENIDFLVSNSQSVHTLLKTKLIVILLIKNKENLPWTLVRTEG